MGGTKMVCCYAESDGELLSVRERATFPTRGPEETIGEMAAFFKGRGIDALGVGCFGPLELNRRSAAYGHIARTPKPGWSGYDVAGAFSRALGVPVGFDTDVNGAVLGEVMCGAARGCDSAVYVTVGTGVGVGAYCNGGLIHGLTHPEAGHIFVARRLGDDYEGCCPFHGGCLEGLASGSAIEGRWGLRGEDAGLHKEAWELEAFYLAEAVANYCLAYSPQKIILGGGVMHREGLISMVRENARDMLAGYVCHPLLEEEIDSYIVPPALIDNAGIVGAACLGLLACGAPCEDLAVDIQDAGN